MKPDGLEVILQAAASCMFTNDSCEQIPSNGKFTDACLLSRYSAERWLML